MRKHLWKAAAVSAVLVMTISALTALAQEKKTTTAPKAAEQTMPGCSMKSGASKEMPGCSMQGGTSKAMPGCGAKSGMGKDCCAGCCMQGGMKGCGMQGGMGHGMAGCGMKGGMGHEMAGCGMKGGMGRGMAGGPMCGPGMGGGARMMLEGLDLTAEQQKKVADLHERQARQAIQAQADLRIATMDLQTLLRADTPDKAKIDAQIDRVAGLRAQMQKSRTATLLEVRAMLTPEQLKKWRAGVMEDEGDSD